MLDKFFKVSGAVILTLCLIILLAHKVETSLNERGQAAIEPEPEEIVYRSEDYDFNQFSFDDGYEDGYADGYNDAVMDIQTDADDAAYSSDFGYSAEEAIIFIDDYLHGDRSVSWQEAVDAVDAIYDFVYTVYGYG